MRRRLMEQVLMKLLTVEDIPPQNFALCEMGYEVRKLQFYSMIDNKTYPVELPAENDEMRREFEKTIENIRSFNMDNFVQDNIEKCRKCIYEPSCDRGLI